MELCSSKRDMASNTSQAAGAIVMPPVMCKGLPNSRIAGGLGTPVPCLRLGGVSKPRGRKWGKLRIVM